MQPAPCKGVTLGLRTLAYMSAWRGVGALLSAQAFTSLLKSPEGGVAWRADPACAKGLECNLFP